MTRRNGNGGGRQQLRRRIADHGHHQRGVGFGVPREIADRGGRSGVLVHHAGGQLHRQPRRVIILHEQAGHGARISSGADDQRDRAIAIDETVAQHPDRERAISLARRNRHRRGQLEAVRIRVEKGDHQVSRGAAVAQQGRDDAGCAAAFADARAVQRQFQPGREADRGRGQRVVVREVRLVEGRSGVGLHREPAVAHYKERQRHRPRHVRGTADAERLAKREAAQQLWRVRVDVIDKKHLVGPGNGRRRRAVVRHRPAHVDRLAGQTRRGCRHVAHREVGIQRDDRTARQIGVVVQLGIQAVAELEDAVARIKEQRDLDIARAGRAVGQREARRA